MTYAEALHIAKVVKNFTFTNEIHADRAAILEHSKTLHPAYTTGVEMATAEYIMKKANPVAMDFLR
jgi:DnaJ-domain-containing protein 1